MVCAPDIDGVYFLYLNHFIADKVEWNLVKSDMWVHLLYVNENLYFYDLLSIYYLSIEAKFLRIEVLSMGIGVVHSYMAFISVTRNHLLISTHFVAAEFVAVICHYSMKDVPLNIAELKLVGLLNILRC